MTDFVIDGPGKYVTRAGGGALVRGRVRGDSDLWRGCIDLTNGRVEDARWDEHGVAWAAPAAGDLVARVPTAVQVDVSSDSPTSEGRKDDTDKLRFELIPPELLTATADILTFGAKKYNDRNWEKGMNWSRVFGALMRHMWAWWRGDKLDVETGKSHLWHAACCLAFLIAYEERKIGLDDRPPSL